MGKQTGLKHSPPGFTVQRIEDLNTDMGLVYERYIGEKKFSLPSRGRSSLLFARGACRLDVRIGSDKRRQSLTSTRLLYLPPESSAVVEGKSAIFDLLVLLPSPEYALDVVRDNQLTPTDAEHLATRSYALKRSRWLDDLVERYFFERVLNFKSPPGCPFFLEKQMLNELVRLIFSDKVPTTGQMLGEEPDNIALSALEFIESNLFQKFDVAAVCSHTKSTQPTLTRSFKRLFGKTPGAYVKERRLDEAAIMIERDDYRVGDICQLIGYEDLASFSKAFKERFGISPREYRERHAATIV